MRCIGTVLVLAVLLPGLARAEFIAKDSDFKCLFEGVRPAGKNFFVFHKNKRKLRKAVRVAERDKPSKRYPVGTILQVFPFEAMVKRGGRFNHEGNGWEWIQLAVTKDGATIAGRGGPELTNRAGSCQTCHEGAKSFDLVCEGHGAATLGFTDAQIRGLQKLEPRCPAPE
jgi:hypothetical protein